MQMQNIAFISILDCNRCKIKFWPPQDKYFDFSINFVRFCLICDERDDFEIVNFPFLFLALHPMEVIVFNSSDLLEHLAVLLTSTLTTN